MPYANNKGADQPAYPRSLISAFMFTAWMVNTSACYSLNYKTLASLISWAGQFWSYLVANPEGRFSRDEVQKQKETCGKHFTSDDMTYFCVTYFAILRPLKNLAMSESEACHGNPRALTTDSSSTTSLLLLQ